MEASGPEQLQLANSHFPVNRWCWAHVSVTDKDNIENNNKKSMSGMGG